MALVTCGPAELSTATPVIYFYSTFFVVPTNVFYLKYNKKYIDIVNIV